MWLAALQGLTGERRSPGASLKALEARFASQGVRSGAERMTVVLVDEIDLLVTRTQSVRPPGCWPPPACCLADLPSGPPHVQLGPMTHAS